MHLGLGAGLQEREHRNYGFELGSIDERMQRFEEGLEVVTRLFRNERASFDGDFYQIDDAVLKPKSRSGKGPSITIGGNGIKRTLPIAVQYADEWNGVFLTPEEFQQRSQRLDELLEEAGRDPETLRRTLMLGCAYAENQQDADAKAKERGTQSAQELRERSIAAGSAKELIPFLKEYEERGCQRVMLQWLELDNLKGLEAMGRALLPEFKG